MRTKFITEKQTFHAHRLIEEVILSLKRTRKNNKEQLNQICSCRVERRNESKRIKPIYI
jgi:hypothetical protein